MAHDRGIWGIHPDNNADAIEQLVQGIYAEIARRPADLALLKEAMAALLSYLASSEGRTDQNCKVMDTFFCVRDNWEIDWHHLPAEFQRILEDLGGCLHDTVSSPQVARDFESTPEQLLNRVRGIVVQGEGDSQ
jgi:hypothetical protein